MGLILFFRFPLQIRKTQRVSMFPVGFIAGLPVSAPVLDKDGKFVRMLDGWNGKRKYPVDMASFAVNLKHFIKVCYLAL